ncbi:MAG: hypothetical protein RL173_1652 [Fibrobacterota bacterium]|jgi:predicted AAA+ superfamily ATPase
MNRWYQNLLRDHFQENRQLALVSGPRQCGKTTASQNLYPESHYLTWDSPAHRERILAGHDALAMDFGLDRVQAPPMVVFDEVQKYPDWKNWLKGFFDVWGAHCRILATGSARLDHFSRGGDSLMGRYLRYRMNPLSVGELAHPDRCATDLLLPPRQILADDWSAMRNFGCFPEPFLRRDKRFFVRWSRLRMDQAVREDLRDLTRATEISRVELLAELVRARAAQSLTFSDLARGVRSSVESVQRWVDHLEALHLVFLVRPWHRNVNKALTKEPKVYLRDFSTITDPGARYENMVACHLLKAVESWEDAGLGTFALHYLRDTEKREVDFLVVRDDQPWFLVEAKTSDPHPTASLKHFQAATHCPHAFQLVQELPYVEIDPFTRHDPVAVPALTLLSMLP